MLILLVILGIIILLIMYIISIKNSFVRLDNINKEAWSNVKVYLQKRLDLIPNLVNTVKGYAEHEKSTLEKVIEARSNLIKIDMNNIDNIDKILKAENTLKSTLRSIMALSEQYPNLKADTQFINLQKNLAEIEDDILSSRKYYNATCRNLNIFVEKLPNSLFYGLLNFRKATLFEPTENVEKVPEVKF